MISYKRSVSFRKGPIKKPTENVGARLGNFILCIALIFAVAVPRLCTLCNCKNACTVGTCTKVCGMLEIDIYSGE